MKISEAATGVGEQMADVGLAMQRAVDKTENMKARADAVSELEAAGTFDDVTALGSGEDDIDRQLKQLSEPAGGRRGAGEDEGGTWPGRRSASRSDLRAEPDTPARGVRAR